MNEKITNDGWNSSFMDVHGWTSPIIHELAKLNEYSLFKMKKIIMYF